MLGLQLDGDFEDLGRVGLATSAAANILSKTRLIDAGNTVTYDAHADVYHLHGSERSYVFSRKLNSNGSRSSHYACDMARPAHTDILIAVALYRIICTCTVCTYTYTRYTAYRTLDLVYT